MATIKEMTQAVIDGFLPDEDVRTAEGAWGLCYNVTEYIQQKFDLKKTIYSFHDNDPNHRYEKFKQHSDHHALMHRGKVLDFTLRQFKEDTPWPFYGTIEEWKSILEDAWDTTVDHHFLESPDEYFIYYY